LYSAERDINNFNHMNISGGKPVVDFGASTFLSQDTGYLRAHFRDLDEWLAWYIRDADHVVGCVAWLTYDPILSALSETKGVSIVVQKEDFLRPDYGYRSRDSWKNHLRRLYSMLPSTLTRYDSSLRELGVYMLSFCSDPTIDAVRCVGFCDGSRQRPLMHHKFFVFCRDRGESFNEYGESEKIIEPYGVWTGSYNPTKNAVRSLENAIFIYHEPTAQSFFREWGQVVALSEPLDWTAEYANPQWRVGS